METIFTILAGYDLGIVGILLLIIAGLLWLYYKGQYDNIKDRIVVLEKYRTDHDTEHKQLAEKCGNRHTWNGITERRK